MTAAKKKKAALSGSADPRKPQTKKTADAGAPASDSAKPPVEESDDELLDWEDIPGLDAAGEPDPAEVERAANQVFENVLRRFGWARNERGGIEHVGESDEARPLKKAS